MVPCMLWLCHFLLVLRFVVFGVFLGSRRGTSGLKELRCPGVELTKNR